MGEIQTEKNVSLGELAYLISPQCHVIDGDDTITPCSHIEGTIQRLERKVDCGDLTRDEAVALLSLEFDGKCMGIGNVACGDYACNFGIRDGIVDFHL